MIPNMSELSIGCNKFVHARVDSCGVYTFRGEWGNKDDSDDDSDDDPEVPSVVRPESRVAFVSSGKEGGPSGR